MWRLKERIKLKLKEAKRGISVATRNVLLQQTVFVIRIGILR